MKEKIGVFQQVGVHAFPSTRGGFCAGLLTPNTLMRQNHRMHLAHRTRRRQGQVYDRLSGLSSAFVHLLLLLLSLLLLF